MRGSKRSDVIIGDSVARRGGNPLASLAIRVGMCVCCFIAVILFISASWGSNDGLPAQQAPPRVPRWIGDEKTPLVVLYHGKPEEAPYEWNTGVWPGWGERMME